MWLYDYSIGDDIVKYSQGGNQSIRGHMYPRSNATYDIGSLIRWRNIYTMTLIYLMKVVKMRWMELGVTTQFRGESEVLLINKRNGKNTSLIYWRFRNNYIWYLQSRGISIMVELYSPILH